MPQAIAGRVEPGKDNGILKLSRRARFCNVQVSLLTGHNLFEKHINADLKVGPQMKTRKIIQKNSHYSQLNN